MKKHRIARRLWGMPILIGLASLVGLVNALVYNGWGDTISWLLLAIPLYTIFFFVRKARV